MNYSELMRKIKQGQISPVYLFYGEESYLINDAVEQLVSKIVNPATKSLNLETFYGKEASVEEIVNKSQSLPFMAEYRVLIFRGIDELSVNKLDLFNQYILNPVTSTCLIFIAEKVDFRKNFYSALKKNAETVQFNPLFENQAVSWIKNRVKNLDFNITEKDCVYLLENVGQDLNKIENEIEKIVNYAKGKKSIEKEDIDNVVGDIKIHSIFNLVDAIGEKEVDKALKILSKMIDQGEPPLKILSMIIRQFRLIWWIKSLLGKNKSLEMIAKEVRISSWSVKKIINQTKIFSYDELLGGFYRFLEADLKLKSSRQPAKMILEFLILDLYRGEYDHACNF